MRPGYKVCAIKHPSKADAGGTIDIRSGEALMQFLVDQ
jgi:hypothetical protein